MEADHRISWDNAYTVELTNHASNADDEGTIWFSDASAEERIIAYLEDLSDTEILHKDTTSFLDLGTGNGHLLFALREEEWQGKMLGVDYSAASVKLAQQIGKTHQEHNEEFLGVEFEEWDILNEKPGTWLEEGFDVVLDKGTFDAISLSDQIDDQGRRVCEGYKECVEPLIKPGGRLLITSCNWTNEELRAWFEVESGQLEFEARIKYPNFTFGGKTGQQVCTLSFKRKSR